MMPNKDSDLIRLSKYSRIAEWIMSRPQIQEEAISAGRSAGRNGEAGWSGGRHGGRSLLHALARHKGQRVEMTNSVMRGVFLEE
jgi:GTP cyclohydrolase I